jgi:hypothetical protein
MTQTATAIESQIIESAVAYAAARRAMDGVKRNGRADENQRLFDNVIDADKRLLDVIKRYTQHRARVQKVH